MIRNIAILAVAIILFAGCKQNDDILTKQQESTVRYLTSAHSPRLMTEQEAAEACGFSDACNLIRAFKRHFKTTPRRYIASHANALPHSI